MLPLEHLVACVENLQLFCCVLLVTVLGLNQSTQTSGSHYRETSPGYCFSTLEKQQMLSQLLEAHQSCYK